MWNTLQKEEELPEWAILLPSVQDIQDWRPKWINRIFGNQDWKETRWDTRMNSANPDIANFEKSQVRRRGAQRRTKHPNIKYHHWREEVRKGIISISTYHTGTKWQKADKPFSDLLTNVWRKKMIKDWDQDRQWTEYFITLKWGSVSIRTYSERSQRSTQEPNRDPSRPEGTVRTLQATDSRAYATKRYTVIEYCATHYATWHMNCNICTVQYDIRHAYGGHKTLHVEILSVRANRT